MLDMAALFPADLPGPAHWEARFPPRDLAATARVTRFAPSPTGALHIGGVYAALVSQDLARHSGGVYLVRIEDTDQAREVPDVTAQFDRAFRAFDVVPDESDTAGGAYGPYTQSRRADVYLTYVRELLRTGAAYPCFATREELAANADQQRAEKVPTGYYGRWATWRDAPEDAVRAALAETRPYVVRFRSGAAPGDRFTFTDAVRGRIEMDANRNDVVILKSGERPLPTYHFAHPVDDHLMRIDLIVRGEEWLPSTPLHAQLFAALGFAPVEYAHIAPLLKLDRGNKRKLSKRKDPEASVDHYIEAGYPPEAVRYYLRGLMNGRLAELPPEAAREVPLRLDAMSAAGPLVDLAKLDDICADHVATLPGARVLDLVGAWAGEFDPELVDALDAERDVALRALAIEREGVANPRKDLRRWSEFRRVYGYFLTSLFTPPDALPDKLGDLDPALVTAYLDALIAGYRDSDDPAAWFDRIRVLAAAHGLSVRDAAQVVRVAVTGSTRSPDLYAVARCLGRDEVVRRLRERVGRSRPGADTIPE